MRNFVYLKDLRVAVIQQRQHPERIWSLRVCPRSRREREAIITRAEAEYLHWRPDDFCILVGTAPASIEDQGELQKSNTRSRHGAVCVVLEGGTP